MLAGRHGDEYILDMAVDDSVDALRAQISEYTDIKTSHMILIHAHSFQQLSHKQTVKSVCEEGGKIFVFDANTLSKKRQVAHVALEPQVSRCFELSVDVSIVLIQFLDTYCYLSPLLYYAVASRLLNTSCD